MKHILRCMGCGKYTLKEECSCGGTAATPNPAKFSPDDHYGSYRRKAKLDAFKSRGLI